MDDPVEAAKARSADFSTTKPLPPIGVKSDEELSQHSNKSNTGPDNEDASSVNSNSGSARPRILRRFRPESSTDDKMDDDDWKQRPLTERRKTYDGREITMVTLDTQTDWDWVEKTEMESVTYEGDRRKSQADVKEKISLSPKSVSKQESTDDKGTSEQAHYQMPYNDEYGIPILDLSSDTDDINLKTMVPIIPRKKEPKDAKAEYVQQSESPSESSVHSESSDEEVSYKMKDDRQFMPSVGPPNILQYQRESEKQEIQVDEPELRVAEEEFDKDESGLTHGIFSGTCEFCKQLIKPFPSIEQQLQFPPETLYCCNEYREFVDYVMSTTRDMEEEQNQRNKLIDIKPHEHVGSKQERNAAREKAVQRMRERELQRRQQEASGLQQNFFAFARQMKTINYQLSSQKCLEEGWTVRAPSPMMDDDGNDVFVPEPLNPAMIAEGKVPLVFLRANPLPGRKKTSKSVRDFCEVADPEQHLNFGPVTTEESHEVKLAYRPDSEFYKQRVSYRALEELRDRPLIEKFYENGQKFLTMFPDGTGNVFYPSGNLAILISSIKLGQYYYTIHYDSTVPRVAAAFDPNGYGYCYFPTGDIRLYIDQYGGIELDTIGGRRRRWTWKDQVTHVHAPPFQPICIGLNKNMGVRVMSQENIALTFSCDKRSCRFNMGSRLRLVAPENAPLKEVEEDYIFLEEKKAQVEALLSKVTNLLKFPNNPKLEKMLPPLHVTAKQNKTEKLKKDRQVYLEQMSAREKKQSSISVN